MTGDRWPLAELPQAAGDGSSLQAVAVAVAVLQLLRGAPGLGTPEVLRRAARLAGEPRGRHR